MLVVITLNVNTQKNNLASQDAFLEGCENMKDYIHVIGGGLAGCEAAYYIAQAGIKVKLHEQRPTKTTGAHHSDLLGELVCSNSLKSKSLENACGLLKEEMRQFHSLIMQAADANTVEAGQALAVDRDLFATFITKTISNHPNIEIIHEEVTEIFDGISVIATGPLTSEALSSCLSQYFGNEDLYFYDAAAPLIYKDSIDMEKVYRKDRYDKGNADYYNCPFTKEEFMDFYNALISAERAKLHSFEKEIYFEGCMPIEVMAKRGYKTLTFGPLKPVGLEKPDQSRPFAVVQLRVDDAASTLLNIVGFQTNLTYAEQKRVFQKIPGLENARFARFGLMHKNTYLCSPKILNNTLVCKKNNQLLLAGQLTGVEGYVESAATGILAGINAVRIFQNLEPISLPPQTVLGSLCNYITTANEKKFQPMNANYGILPHKNDKMKIAEESLNALKGWIEKWNILNNI